MEPKQMLEAVIEKACIGIPEGIDLPKWSLYADVELIKSILKSGYVKAKLKEGRYGTGMSDLIEETMSAIKLKEMMPALLFNHDFAKAFYGYGKFHCCTGEGCAFMYHGWQFHLQQAVLSEDPLLYYYQHLE